MEPPVDLVQVAAMMIAVAITSTGRPFLTLFLLIGVPTVLVDTRWWSAQDWVLPIPQLWVVAALGVLAVMEHFARGRALYAEAIERLPWDRLLVNVIVWLLYVWGLTGAAEPAAPPEAVVGELASSIRGGAPPAWDPRYPLLLVGTLSMNTAASWARRQALDLLRSIGMGGIAHWLESLGVVGVVLVAVFLPIAALVLAALALAPVVAVVLAAKLVERSIDRNRRRPCHGCGHAARVEASLCPKCSMELQIVRPLA